MIYSFRWDVLLHSEGSLSEQESLANANVNA